jgi:hypothetical protein
VLASDFSGQDDQAVRDVRFEVFRFGAGEGRLHSSNALAINKLLDRRRIGIRNEVPHGRRGGIRLETRQRHNLYFGQFKSSFHAKQDIGQIFIPVITPRPGYHVARGVKNLYGFRLEPVREKADVNRCYHDKGGDKPGLFFIHKFVTPGMPGAS